MQSHVLVSVIVPVFNVEAYLDKCVVSILNQTYDNLEIILVDDGSTDRSGMICDRYGQQDSRVVVVHKQNEGLSSARNAGIEKARGEFLAFIDSDDFIELSMIEFLYQNIKTHKVEIAACAICQFKDGSERKEIWNSIEKDQSFDFERYWGLILAKKLDNAACNKMYQKDLLDDVRFEKGKVNEDILFMFGLLKKQPRLHYSARPLYNYRMREKSITQTLNGKTFDFVKNAFFIREEVWKSTSRMGLQADNYLLYEMVSYMSIFFKAGSPHEYRDNVRLCRKFIHSNLLRLLVNSHISMYLTTKALLSAYMPGVFKYLVKLR